MAKAVRENGVRLRIVSNTPSRLRRTPPAKGPREKSISPSREAWGSTPPAFAEGYGALKKRRGAVRIISASTP